MPKSVNTPLQFWLSRILALEGREEERREEGREGEKEGGRKRGRVRGGREEGIHTHTCKYLPLHISMHQHFTTPSMKIMQT